MSQPATPANTWKVPFLINQQCPSTSLDANYLGEMHQHSYELSLDYGEGIEDELLFLELLLWGA